MIVKIGNIDLNNGVKGDKGDTGDTGYTPVKGVDYFDGIGTAIDLDIHVKKALEHRKGYRNNNYFNLNEVQDGYIANGTTSAITPPITNEKVSGKVYLKTGWYSFYEFTTTFPVYVQKFDINDNYIGTITFGGVKNFEMAVDGYVIFDVNRNVLVPLSDIVLADYNPLFTEDANKTTYYNEGAAFEPFFNTEADIQYDKTENLVDVSKILPYTGSEVNIDGYIRIENVIGGSILSIWNQLMPYRPTTKLIVEYNSSNEEIASCLGNTFDKYRQHVLNASTTYFDVLIWDISELSNWGGLVLSEDRLASNFRINFGEHYTKDDRAYRIKSINKAPIPIITNPLKGKKIISFGDSLTSDIVGAVAGSYMDDFAENNEMIIRNYALGHARLLDNSSTTVQTSGVVESPNANNCISNQVETFLLSGFIPDIAIITGGTNDANATVETSASISSVIDLYETPESQNKKTVLGLLFWATKKLREVNPDVKIIFAIPPKANTVGGTTFLTHNANLLSKFVPQYEESAKALGVDIINWYYSFNNLDSTVPNDIYQDALHLSLKSKRIQYKHILSCIKKYFI